MIGLWGFNDLIRVNDILVRDVIMIVIFFCRILVWKDVIVFSKYFVVIKEVFV